MADTRATVVYPGLLPVTFTLMFLPTFVDGILYVEAVAFVITTPFDSHGT